MKINIEEIIRKLESKANTIYFDTDKLKKLLTTAKEKAEGNKQLMEIWGDLKLIIDLVRDWMKGDYKELSKGSAIMIIISLLYLVNPLDLIPDFIVGGFVDDLAVIAYVIKKISDELKIYKQWRSINKEDDTIDVKAEFVEDMEETDDILNEDKDTNEEN
ncbi:YkvA family protein [Tissierella sp. MB52-C2]|uniref:YkvA family protein n=1 Tax=Tissierella sp. MB52-C2 TaxID=3070999 RepID=UPI00280C3183|nr:YkvA family protein [Tissierella sp. MB52-C2]WMM25919.1 YkvA family protein [Tissierella sp. MB52-C2]